MSYPEESNPGAPEERHLTVILVPHGDLETRSYVVPYGRLKLLVVLGVVLLALFGVVLAFWFPIAAQAARVPALERELKELRDERLRVEELAHTLREVEERYERVRQMLGADAPAAGETAPILPPLRPDTTGEAPNSTSEREDSPVDLWPLATAGFITRSLSDGRSRHPGLDIAVAKNTNIRAAGAGLVREAGMDEVYGQFVILEHGGGVETVYGHASRLLVSRGDRVRRGQTIALAGSTGRSTAPHLHFEVRQDGRPVDPLTFVRQP